MKNKYADTRYYIHNGNLYCFRELDNTCAYFYQYLVEELVWNQLFAIDYHSIADELEQITIEDLHKYIQKCKLAQELLK